MNSDRSLLEVAKLLLSEDNDEKAPELLLSRVLGATGADRGFIVVAENGSYEQKFAVRFDGASVTEHELRFSRTVVRRAIDTQAIFSLRMSTSLAQSAGDSGATMVVAAPLAHAGDIYGVVYLEYHESPCAADEVIGFLTEFTHLAGLCLKRAVERDALRRRNRSLEHDLFSQNDFRGIVTRDPKMLELLRTVAQVADTDASVLIRGETGTGKELIARALHVNGARRQKPCVTLHTTALPGSILESELFGHVKGAFTGADRDRPGRIASAHGGTLFLDEVAEIAPDMQAKLLRFLQFGEVQRVGSDRVEKVDVRIIAATHQDLAALVKTGKFRRDLYYRLKVIELFLPPLRDRQGDVPLLAEHFVHAIWKRPGSRPRWTAAAEQALLRHSYPGNVRELAHAVERACILARGPELDVDLLPPEMTGCTPGTVPPPSFGKLTAAALEAARQAAVSHVEQKFLSELMRRHGDNVSAAARHSGLHRTYLQKLLARYRRD